MEYRLIVLAMAFASLSAYGADDNAAPSIGQSIFQMSNGQPQTMSPQDQSKPSTSNAEGTDNQPINQAVESWQLLGTGWKQFDHAGK